MAKKKKKESDEKKFDGLDFFSEKLTNFMANNNLSPLDLLDAMKKMQNGGLAEMMNKVYQYSKPDYNAKTHPLHPALQPLMEHADLTNINSCWKTAAEELKKETPETVREELLNAVYWILAHQDEFINDPEKKRNLMALFLVLQLMIELDVKDVTDALIELLRQDAYFFEFFFSGCEEDMSLAMSKLSTDSLDKLEKYMYETGRIAPTKCIVVDAVVQMALDNPMVKLGVVAWCARVLKRYSEIVVYLDNIDRITWSITQLNAKELAPYIQKLYEINDVPYIYIDGEKGLKKLLENGNDERVIQYASLPEMFSIIEENAKEDKEEGFPEKANDPFFGPWPGMGNDDDEDEALIERAFDDEFYTLEVSLNDSPVEVKRTFKVPSNVSLGFLGQILISVMGWEGYHLNQFIKGKTYYCDRESTEESWGGPYENVNYYQVALNEVLKRKGSKIIWEYDFGDNWEHTLKLVGREDWTSKSKIEVTEAVNACPPEDCGGVWGYDHLIEVLNDKKNPEYKDMKEWVGRGFNPTKVSLQKLNKAVAPFNDEI